MKTLVALLLSTFVVHLGLAQTVPAAEPVPDTWKLETGFGYSRGDYGLNVDTEVYFVPVALVAENAEWLVRASVPWISISGPATAFASTGLLRPTAERESGLGDLQLSGSYKIASDPAATKVNLTGKVKFGTANERRGLGTGATDYTLQLDLLRTFDTVTPFASVGYRWLGDKGVFQLDNGWTATAGLAFRVVEGTSIGAAYEWREAIGPGGDHSSELSVFAYRRLNERWSGTLLALKGFTDASPDYTLAGTLSYTF